tara:strand:+ start:6910 stop:7134 length:225 start_codon:yes stop_codon:yes gene_type:complete
MDLENQILIEENKSLTNRVSTLEKKLEVSDKKLNLALELIKGLSHLVPNLFVKFEDELERMDSGEDTDQRTEYL